MDVYRPCTRRRIVFCIGLFAGALWPAAAVAGPLPRLAVSLPAGATSADVSRLLQACGGQDALVILPAVNVRVGGGGDAAIDASPPIDLPPHAYLHLRVEATPTAAAGREREAQIDRQAADVVRRLPLDRPSVTGLVIEAVGAGELSDLEQFALASVIVKAKGAKPGLEVALVTRMLPVPPRLLAYVDALVVPWDLATGAAAPSAAAMGSAGRPVIGRVSAGGLDEATRGGESLLDALMMPGAAGASTIWLALPGLSALRGACTTMQTLARSLDSGLEMTAPERAPMAVLVDGAAAAGGAAFVSGRSAEMAVLLRAGGTRAAPRSLTLASPPGGKAPVVACTDPLDGRALPASREPSPGCRADVDVVLFRASMPSSSDRVFESVNVTGRASLSVEEIIARWQAAREAERAVLDNYAVPCFLVLHFEATSLSTGFDVALELEQFWDRTGTNDWVQTAFRVNGVKLRKGQEFPLPQLEPDKVVTKPLELRVDDEYAYELAGTDTVDGRLCYVVRIAPEKPSPMLYSGRVWIDGLDFRQVRLELEQRDSKSNVPSHVETQHFERVKDAQGREFTLLRAIDVEESLNLAGRAVTLEKRYRYGEYAINTAAFAARLAATRASDDPMFRDTDDGLRNLRRQDGERVLDPKTTKQVRAVLGGLLYDGGRSYPVPLAGVTFVDFDFRKSGMQLSWFFAGPLLTGSLSKQVNERFRWAVDLSLNALPYTTYQYAGDTELKGEQVTYFEQYTGLLLAWQPMSALSMNTQIDLYHHLYRATDETDPAYRLPATGVTLNLYGEAKYVKKGLTAIATVEHGRRAGWHEFGYPTEPAPVLPNWTRYSIEASQHVYAGKLTRGGVSAGYFGGHDLDRFSRYSPGFFTRPSINGLPNGVDSFDEVTTLGAYYGFNVLDLAKLQGAYTHAWTRSKAEGNQLQQFDGLNFTLGVAGPIGTFVQGSFSVALHGNLERYPSRWGTYLIFLKPWRKQ
jgi:hypothetical protein